MPSHRTALVAALALALAACSGDGTKPPSDDGLHVASPDWRDQVVYFLMTDRFANGDPSNDDQGAGEFDPGDGRKYSGGDLQGVIDHLDYIQGLGATAVWITPPVRNQWWDPRVDYGGYHGYWASNFVEVDPHEGTLETYKALSKALHGRGMYLVQDIVTNHTGNFFDYEEGRWSADDPTQGYIANEGSVPTSKPTQAPFDQNDPRKPEDLAAAIYHWTPAIADYQDPVQEKTFQVSNLDDLNTTNPTVEKALKDSYTYWIEEVGVDAFRIDTAIYVEHPFFADFVHAADGVEAAAEATGRDDFLTFGEAFVSSDPFDDTGDRKVASYLGTADAPELESVLNFPMYFTRRRVFAEGAPTAEMTYRLEKTQELYADPARLLNFVDNHDVGRFLGRSTEAAWRQALAFMMTMPGIPVVYYGTEQAYDETRASLFAGGWGSGGTDHYYTAIPPYNFLQKLITLRKENEVFTRGSVQVLRDSPSGPGLLAIARTYEGRTALMLFNSADEPILVERMDTGLPEGTKLELLRGLVGQEGVTVETGGTLTMELPQREGLILLTTGETAQVTPPAVALTVDTDFSGAPATGDVAVSGTVTGGATAVEVVVDGYLGSAIGAQVAGGTWSATVPSWRFGPGLQTHTLSAFAPSAGVSSDRVTFQTDAQPTGPVVSIDDPEGDDLGPDGAYTLPTAPG